MEKSLFKEYEDWCKKNNKEPLKTETLAEFTAIKDEEQTKEFLEKQEQKKEEMLEKQKEIWKALCEYCGVDVKDVPYEEDYMSEILDTRFKSFILAAISIKRISEMNEVARKIMAN